MASPTEKLNNLLAPNELDSEAVREISQLIRAKELNILQLIESLQPDLLHAQPAQRNRGVSIIARVVEHLAAASSISEKEIELLTEFFCSKLKDHHSILPAALQGLHALSSSSLLPPGLGKVIIQAIFQDVHCQSQMLSERRRFFSTLKNLLTSRLEELQSLGSDFIFGLIQAADQERDPRNLLIVFSLFPIVSRYFKLEPFAEELFEVFSCYFPIDFTPPADDPYGVTCEQLSDALRRCLAASTRYAEYCLPLLQEKLDSDLTSAKVEALRALELCCETYGPAQLDLWIDQLWTSIRREVLINVNSDVLEHAALDSLTALARSFTVDGQITSPAFTKVLQNILKECLGHLCEPERRLMTPSSHILLAICAGSPAACKQIMGQVIPLLLDQFNVRAQSTPRQFILHTLNKMVHAGLYGFTELTAVESGVYPHSSLLVDLYQSVLNENDALLHPLALQGLSHLVIVGLGRSDRIVQTLLSLLNRSAEAESAADGVGKFFRISAEHCPDWAVMNLLPRLFDMIQSDKSQAAVVALSDLPPLPAIREQLVPKIMTLLESGEGSEKTSGLLRVLDPFSRMEGGDREMFQRLHRWTLDSLAGSRDDQPPPSLPAACAILRNLASALSPTDAVQLIHAYLGEHVGRYLTASAWTVPVMEATLGWLDVGQELGSSVASRLIGALEPFATGRQPCQQDVRLSACRLTAALINKLPEGAELEGLLDAIHRRVKEETLSENDLILFTWIAKALVMRSYSKVDASVQLLVDLLDHPTLGYLAAEGFKTILCETEECLNAKSHANVKLLYRQRFFQDVVPRLLDLYRRNKSEDGKKGANRAPVFAAIANQLAFIPHGVLLAHMATLIPLLIQCLGVDQPDQLVLSTIRALLALMADNTTAMLDYLDNLVSRLLVLAKEGKSMHVRQLALKGLSEVRNAPQIVLLPLRSQVIGGLVPCLGDKKRLVRREAALARHKWVILGQPGGQ